MRRHRQLSSWRNSNNRGFAFVISLALGALLTLVVLTLFSRGQNDRAIAASEITQARGAEMAEAAVATYQSFILKYPTLATYNYCQNTGFGGGCSDSGAMKSWYNAPGITSSGENCSPSNNFTSTDLSEISKLAKTSWQSIPVGPSKPSSSANPVAGEIRLVDYRYQPDNPAAGANIAPGTATLLVEGKVGEGIGDSSTSKISLSLKIKAVPQPDFVVGLWAEDFKTSGSKFTINSNVCDASGTNASSDLLPYMGTIPSTGQAAQIVYSTQGAPPSPPEGENPLTVDPGIPGDEVFDILPFKLDGKKVKEACTLPNLGNTSSYCPKLVSPYASTLDENNPSNPRTYKYNIIAPSKKGKPDKAIELGGGTPPGEGLLVLGRPVTPDTPGMYDAPGIGDTIILYVQGNIEAKDSTIKIRPGTRVILYHHEGSIIAKGKKTDIVFDTQDKPENFQIYAYDSTDIIELDAGNISPTRAFIHAPDADVVMENDTQVDGAIWAESWEGKSGVVLNQKIDDPTALTIKVPAGNSISPPTSWQRDIVK
jgi:Tfp pilus assembly protein PilX